MKKLLLLSVLVIFSCSGEDDSNYDILNNQNLVDTWYTSFYSAGVDLVYQKLILEDQSTGSLRRSVLVDGEVTTVYYSDLVWSSNSTALTLMTSIDNNNETFNYVLSTNYEVSNDINTLTITGSDSSILVYTNVPQAGELEDPNFYLTIDELQSGLLNAYSKYIPENDILINSVFTDNCKPGFGNNGQQINFYNWDLSSEDTNVNSLWSSYYNLINQCNRVIESSESESLLSNIVSNTDIDEINFIKGQAYVLRAVAYLALASYFTTDYTDNNALSVIILDGMPELFETFARNTNIEVYDFISNDLNLGLSLIPSSQTNNEFINKDFITGLKARLALLQEDPSAISLAQTLIDSYPLSNHLQYSSIFMDTDNTEVIFKAARSSGSAPVGALWYFTNSGIPFIEASNSLYNSFLQNVEDVRLFVNINFGSDNGGPSYPADNIHLINKYPGNITPFSNDVKVMRVSEMYLIKAEAQVTANDLDGAAETLKTIRDARFGYNTDIDFYSSQTDAYGAVLNERRLELAFEGHRYLDIKRFKDRLNMGINRDVLDCAVQGNCIMPPSDYRLTLPIPQVELNANPSMVQNPGY